MRLIYTHAHLPRHIFLELLGLGCSLLKFWDLMWQYFYGIHTLPFAKVLKNDSVAD